MLGGIILDSNKNFELENLMKNIKRKIINDDIMNKIYNEEDIFSKANDWKINCAKDIVESYKKLLKVMGKIN